MSDARSECISKLHLDLVGGIAGDMFAASLLDAFPDFWPACLNALTALNLGSGVTISKDKDTRHHLVGTVFSVTGFETTTMDHDHVHWREIRKLLRASELSEQVKTIACEIFSLLADAEASVHGTTAEHVAFHEVGAVDSIVDIVMAATLINAIGDCYWSVGPLPLGRGMIDSQHGKLPLPAPAAALLLKGFVSIQDEEFGERITPTGAAILKFLNPKQDHDPIPRKLFLTGIGLGTRHLKLRANMLRVCAFVDAQPNIPVEFVDVLRCEIDDQTGEDLAVALDRIREATGVRDVCQWPVIGKKGRLAVAVQVIVARNQGDAITALLLDETCTLGVRHQVSERSLVAREFVKKDGIRLKLAHRPTGTTVKAEMDDLQSTKGHLARQARRQRVETTVLDEMSND